MALSDLPEAVKLMPTPFVLLAFVAALYALYRHLLPHPIPGIPYDPKSAQKLLGDAPDMLREVDVTRELNEWLVKQVYKFQAPLCQVFVQPFSQAWLLLADSVEARDIMIRRPEFNRSNFITDGLSPLDGFHARMKTGKVWKTTRTWLQDLIGPTFLNNIVGPRMYRNSLHLVEFWQTKAHLANGRPFDDMNHSAFDGMLSILFDENFKHTALGPQIQAVSQLDPSSVETGPNGEAKFPEGPLNEFIAVIYETVDAIDKVTKSMSPTFSMWWIRQTPRFKEIIAIKNRVVREQIQGAVQRLQATGKNETAIEYMLMRETKAAEKQGRKADYENPTMIEEISGQFVAGLHTTSTNIAWTFIYLTRLPDIQAKLRNSLQATYAAARAESRTPTLAELSKARSPYLEAVLEEALRLHATSVARQTIRDTELMGYHIPKDTNVIVIANGPGFHAPSFAVDASRRSPTAKAENGWAETGDMKAFDPERWLVRKEGASDNEVEFDANAAPQIAFGMGPRSCWGRRLAYLELRLVVALVVWNFDLLEVPQALADPKASYGIVHRADQCCLRLKSRQESLSSVVYF